MPETRITISASDIASAAFEKVSQSVTGLFSSFPARVAEGVLLRDVVHSIVDQIKDMATALPELALKGAAVADVEENFERLTAQAGLLGDKLMGQLRAGTHNTISDFELMKTANKDLAAGLNLTDQQFGTLAKGAFALAQATGGDVKTALETMNDAMLTGRTRSLALLTGKIDETAAEERYAKTLGVTAEHLSDSGKLEAKRIAILEGVADATKRLGDQTDGLDERVAQAQAAWANFQENLGKTIATSPVVMAGLDGIKDAITEAFGSNQQTLVQTIAHGVDQVAIHVADVGITTVETARVANSAWSAIKTVVLTVETVIVGMVTAIGEVLLAADRMASKLHLVDPEETAKIERTQIGLRGMTASLAAQTAEAARGVVGQSEFDKTLDKVGGSLYQIRDRMVAASQAAGEHVKTVTADGAAHEKLAAQTHESAAEIKRHAEEQKKLAGELLKVEHSLTEIPAELSKIGRSYDESKLGKMADEIAKVEQSAHILNFGYKGMAEALENVGEKTKVAIDEADKWASVGPQLDIVIGKTRLLDDTLATIPSTIAAALTGGGGMIGAANAVGSTFGKNLGSRIGESLTKSLTTDADGLVTKGLSPLMGDLVKSIPVVGAAVGALIGPAIEGIKKLFGLGASAAELAGRKVEASFEQQFGGFEGMMAAVGRAYEATGRGAAAAQADVKALLDAEKGGGAGVQAMIDKINGAFSDEQKKAGDVSKAVDGILAAAKATGADFPDAMQPLVAQLEALPGLTDAERDSLLGLTGAVKPNFADLTKVAKDYGLGLTDLGPAFEQANISGRADKILTDFGALSKAGADSDHVLHGMGSSINTLINDAITYGSTLPTALKPLAEQLAKTGQLTDAAGNKLDDLSSLKFNDDGDELATGLSKLTDAINKLGDLLSPTSSSGLAAKAAATAAAIGTSLGSIPDKHISVYVDRVGDDGDTGYVSRGGFITRHGIEYLGDGGFVPRGTDTIPAMLTPGEAVLNRSAVSRLGRSAIADINRGGNGDTHVGHLAKALREDNAALHATMKQIANTLRLQGLLLPRQIAEAVQLGGGWSR